MLINDQKNRHVTHPEFDLPAHFSNALHHRFEGFKNLDALSDYEIQGLLGIKSWCITAYDNPLHQQVASALWQYRNTLNTLVDKFAAPEKAAVSTFVEHSLEQTNQLAGVLLDLVDSKKSALRWYELADTFLTQQHQQYNTLLLPLLENDSELSWNAHLVLSPIANIDCAMQWVAIGMSSPHFQALKAPQFMTTQQIKNQAKQFQKRLHGYALTISRSAAYDFYCECLGYPNGYQQLKPVLGTQRGHVELDFILNVVNNFRSSLNYMLSDFTHDSKHSMPIDRELMDSLSKRLHVLENDSLSSTQLQKTFNYDFLIELQALLDTVFKRKTFALFHGKTPDHELYHHRTASDELCLLLFNQLIALQQHEPLVTPTNDMAVLEEEEDWWAAE
jgi:hypothetical protein